MNDEKTIRKAVSQKTGRWERLRAAVEQMQVAQGGMKAATAEFQNTLGTLGREIDQLGKSMRAYRRELKNINVGPLRQKALLLAQRSDDWVAVSNAAANRRLRAA